MAAPKRVFHAEPAVRKAVPLLVGIMSPSGGGKTFSALRLATGIQRVMGGDTENYRMLHYADKFKFHHVPFKAPFGSLDYLEALRWCNGQGARITIVDSMTHEHNGEGGYLETAENVVTRMAGDDYRKREAVKMLGWATAGPLRQKMIEGIKQLDGAFIFCFRAKEKTKPVRNKEGKTDIVDMGLMPIAGEEWVYEMTVNCMLEPRSEGVPTWRSDYVGERLMMKLPMQFKHIFADAAPLSEDIGEKLASWAAGSGGTSTGPTVVENVVDVSPTPTPAPPEPAGGTPPQSSSPPPAGAISEDEMSRRVTVETTLRNAAADGYKTLAAAWNALPTPDHALFKALRDRHLIPEAREVDAARAPKPTSDGPKQRTDLLL
jgi:hypothetical protein